MRALAPFRKLFQLFVANDSSRRCCALKPDKHSSFALHGPVGLQFSRQITSGWHSTRTGQQEPERLDGKVKPREFVSYLETRKTPKETSSAPAHRRQQTRSPRKIWANRFWPRSLALVAWPNSLQSHVAERSWPPRVRSGESFQTGKRFSSAAHKPRALDRSGRSENLPYEKGKARAEKPNSFNKSGGDSRTDSSSSTTRQAHADWPMRVPASYLAMMSLDAHGLRNLWRGIRSASSN